MGVDLSGVGGCKILIFLQGWGWGNVFFSFYFTNKVVFIEEKSHNISYSGVGGWVRGKFLFWGLTRFFFCVCVFFYFTTLI
jgi:hypothetical protein